MAIKDIGPEPYTLDLEKETVDNPNYRTVAWTGKYLQMTLMSIPVGGDIGLELHPQADQFIRLDGGKGKVQIGDSEDSLDFEAEVQDGHAVFVPAGKWHNITNTGDEPMQLYTIYAPVHHAQGIVQKTKEDAEADEEAKRDEPPSWTEQPKNPQPDQSADSDGDADDKPKKK